MLCKTVRDDLNECLGELSAAVTLARNPLGSWRIVHDVMTFMGPMNGPTQPDEVRLFIGPWVDEEYVAHCPEEWDTGEGRWVNVEIPTVGHWRLPAGGNSRWYLDNATNSADEPLWEWNPVYLRQLEDILAAGLHALANFFQSEQAIECPFCGTPRHADIWLCPHCEG